MGSRREADVLLTDGIITGGFTRGGQLPTLNIANEFQDFDEPWYESCIGWQGATALLEYVSGPLKLTAEGTFIGYATNAQGRDTKNQYPDFLYTNGFTDTTAFTAAADYANVYARGKDPRSVYAEFQDRSTYLAVLNAAVRPALLVGRLRARQGQVRPRLRRPQQELRPPRRHRQRTPPATTTSARPVPWATSPWRCSPPTS